MSEEASPGPVAKKSRKPRSASKYMLLQEWTSVADGDSAGEASEMALKDVGHFSTPKAAWAFATKEKLAGGLQVVCFRGRKVGEVQQMFTLT